ncbi:1-aminocyclopropane-1-carboxylate oxidase homolog 1-like isoform X2 [Punica granatum]|uniref:1-aminocyclopropane-1-carboxylate oxidase homolog 1-like isoform X2 n=1 Tax=Punica granatum TaxID=22663 RepID=A0A6P8DPG2_PUNGR|nr:1-aminocyclopropane-1-carboxylate oxidase homolog 1-like isoform X2 [Punica granatum]
MAIVGWHAGETQRQRGGGERKLVGTCSIGFQTCKRKMSIAGTSDPMGGNRATSDRYQELKSFDESKAGVKGLVDSGIVNIPRIFIRPPDEVEADEAEESLQYTVPVVDLGDLSSRRAETVSAVLEAARDVGFFQVVNHGIPVRFLEEMLAVTRAFHELPRDVKVRYYSREQNGKVKLDSNFDLYESKFANWRDTLFCVMGPDPLDPEELPPVCRDMYGKYSKEVQALGVTLFKLLSEALGLKPDYLADIDCPKGHAILGHYYPACPEPELTLGTSGHWDPDFLTILLQDSIGGLQFRYQNHWIDVPPVPGALVVNIGDLLQLISNDLFKSVEHRVLASKVGPRISIACFFTFYDYPTTRGSCCSNRLAGRYEFVGICRHLPLLDKILCFIISMLCIAILPYMYKARAIAVTAMLVKVSICCTVSHRVVVWYYVR